MLRAIRDAAWERCGGHCEAIRDGRRCGRYMDRANWEGHVHHVIYRGYGRERLSDLEVRCLECHGREHPNRTFRTRAEQAAIAIRRGRCARH